MMKTVPDHNFKAEGCIRLIFGPKPHLIIVLPCLSLVHSLLDLTDMFQVAAEDTLELNTSWLC